jgi:acetylornithine/N-succinyldiaminopimelate aminotransferase
MPFTQGFKFAEPNKDSISETLTKNTCAIMIELVQGEGGVNALDKEFVSWLYGVCKKQDILLIVDEVQTGNGRTGSLYAYMQYGILPDIVTTAKGLGNGLPIGATMLGAKVKNTLTYGTHGSTFGGNLVACAGAIAVIDSLTDELLSEVTKKSEYIIKELSAVNGVKGVTGLGFMLGISCENAKTAIETCRERGLLVLTAKDKVRLLPPLNVSWETLKQAVEILKGALEK